MKKVVVFLCFLTFGAFGIAQPSNTLPPGGVLTAEQYLQSNDGVFRLVMQTDCNLVLSWMGPNGQHRAIAQTNTAHRGLGCFLKMQEDGNLVVKDQYKNFIFGTDTQNHQGAYAVLKNASEGEIADRLVILHNNHQIYSSARFPGQDMVGVRFR